MAHSACDSPAPDTGPCFPRSSDGQSRSATWLGPPCRDGERDGGGVLGRVTCRISRLHGPDTKGSALIAPLARIWPARERETVRFARSDEQRRSGKPAGQRMFCAATQRDAENADCTTTPEGERGGIRRAVGPSVRTPAQGGDGKRSAGRGGRKTPDGVDSPNRASTPGRIGRGSRPHPVPVDARHPAVVSAAVGTLFSVRPVNIHRSLTVRRARTTVTA